MVIHIYTDGSCRHNGFPDAVGAWGFVALHLGETISDIIECVAGSERPSTNQRMELKAALQACYWVKNHMPEPTDAVIFTDSAYLHNCIDQKWYKTWQKNGWVNSKKQPVLNKDLWEELIPFFEDHNFEFAKVPGHANNVWNNYIDKIVQQRSAEEFNGSSN